jgi:hypothetical protein
MTSCDILVVPLNQLEKQNPDHFPYAQICCKNMQIPEEVTPFGNNVVPLGTNISGTAGLRWKQTKIRGALFFCSNRQE